MKHLNFSIPSVVIVLGFVLGSSLSVDAGVVVKVSAAIAPRQSSEDPNSSLVWNWRAIYCAEHELSGMGGDQYTMPSAYNALDGFTLYTSMITTSGRSWRARANPTGNLNTMYQWGSTLAVVYHIIAEDQSSRFTICGVTEEQFCSYELFCVQERDIFRTFSPDCVGINYGPDGIKSADDIRYQNYESFLCSDQPMLDELVVIGMRSSWPGGSSQAEIDSRLDSLVYESPVQLTNTIRVRDSKNNLLGQGSKSVSILRSACAAVGDVSPTWEAGNGLINVDDLLAVIRDWGSTGTSDVNADGIVNVADLLAVIGSWGTCG